MALKLGRRRTGVLRRTLGALILAAGFWLVITGLPAWLVRLIAGIAVVVAGWSLINENR